MQTRERNVFPFIKKKKKKKETEELEIAAESGIRIASFLDSWCLSLECFFFDGENRLKPRRLMFNRRAVCFLSNCSGSIWLILVLKCSVVSVCIEG